MAVRKFLYNSSGDLKQSTTSDDLSINKITLGISQGTAPLVVTSNTLVSNLNADKLDGNEASAFANSSHNHTVSEVTDFDTEVANNGTVTSNTSSRHTQGTDTGTTQTTFHIDSDNTGPKLKNVSGYLEVRNSADSGYANLICNDLTVKGTTTTIESETITLADNLIVLNNNFTGSPPVENGGLEIERGTLPNASFLWDESNDYWSVGISGAEARIISSGTNISLLNNDSSFITTSSVTYETLDGNSDVGTASTQVSKGDHSHTVSDLSDTTITSIATGELLKWSGSAWINNTLSEAGISATGHNHDGIYFTETELSSSTSSSGSDKIGDDDNYSNFTPAAATVKGALSGIDTELGTLSSGANKVSITYTAGTGGIAQYDVVYVSANDTVLKADASAISTGRVVGIAESAITAAASGIIVTDGLLASVGTGWTAGAPVFLSETAAALTQTAPSTSDSVIIQVGIAKNATDLQIQIGLAIINS